MPLFGHRHQPPPQPSGNPVTIPDGARHAASQGWQTIAGPPLPADLHKGVHRVTAAMYGASQVGPSTLTVGGTTYADTYRLAFEGRNIVVANAKTAIERGLLPSQRGTPAVSVCAVELPVIIPMTCIQPRDMGLVARYHVDTGNPAFDTRFRVVTAAGDLLRQLLTLEVQQRIAAHDDWALWLDGTHLVTIGKGLFIAGYEMSQRIAETIGIVAALPVALVPRQVDHSTDDLLVRIDRLDSVEAAMSFLQNLTPDERSRLARSKSPLAAFADVRSPVEAIARLQSMDTSSRMQLLAMFSNAGG